MPDLRYGGVGRPATAAAAVAVLARIAHELFWLGRNLARAEHTARMLDGVFQAVAAGPRPTTRAGVDARLGLVLAIMGAPPGDGPGAPRRGPARADARRRRARLGRRAASARAREGARTVRDVISAEMWEAVNTTHLALVRAATSPRACASGPYSVYRYVKERSALFWGLTVAHDAARRGLAPSSPPAGASSRPTWSCGCCASRCRRTSRSRRARRRPARRWRCCRPSAASRPTAARCPRRPTRCPVARFLLFERTYPDSVAASVDAVHNALDHADAQPAQLRAGAAPAAA